MRVFRKLWSVGFALILSASAACGGNVTAPTGPLEPSQITSIVNQLVATINAQVNGILASFNTQSATIASTAPRQLYVYTLPASQLSVVGQAIRVTCWGTTASNTNAKTMALSFGNSPVITNYFSTANVNLTGSPGAQWQIEMIVTKAGAASGWVVGRGSAAASTVSSYAVATTADFSIDATATCYGLNGSSSAGDIVADGMLVEQIK